jgi:monofunctional biosynthetic peptidoglycan transglycosylase
MAVARVPVSMKAVSEKMRQIGSQLKSARDLMGRVPWGWSRRKGLAGAETSAVWAADAGTIAPLDTATVTPPDAGLRERRPQLFKVLRLVSITLVVFLALPYFLILVYRFVDPPLSALMLRNAALLRGVDYRWRDFDRISPNLAKAAIISEDSRFCQHWGVDWTAVGDAIDEFLEEGEVPRGASTIPMQTVKNLFLWPEQDFIRKALEVPLAHFMTLVWPKQRVIEVYLNIAEWGPGIYGAEAAARYHFHTSAASLNRAQAALLVSALPNPRRRNAGQPGPGMRNLAARVQGRVERESPDAACVFKR